MLDHIEHRLNLLELKCRRPVEHVLAGEYQSVFRSAGYLQVLTSVHRFTHCGHMSDLEHATPILRYSPAVDIRTDPMGMDRFQRPPYLTRTF